MLYKWNNANKTLYIMLFTIIYVKAILIAMNILRQLVASHCYPFTKTVEPNTLYPRPYTLF